MMSQNNDDSSIATLESLHELRAEVAHLTHLMHGQSVDIQLLEEKISNLTLKKRELLSGTLEALQQKVDQMESALTNTRMHVENAKKQQQHTIDVQLQRLVSLENKVSQHDSSLHIIKDIKNMMTQMKTPASSYRVESGDTLEAISRKFGIRIQEIKMINNLDSDQIQAGQVLKLPL